MRQKVIELVEQQYSKSDLPEFRVGDTVDVHVKIVEGNRTRTQVFNGVVIARRGGGATETFTVRRIVTNEDVKRRGKVRRAKLYYLRSRVGKARRLRELRSGKARRTTSRQSSTPPPPESEDVSEPEPVAAS